MWYWVQLDGGERVAIGNGGFKGRPDADGMVEVGYSVMDAYQRRGLCTEAVGALIAWAFSHPEVARVVAETNPDNIASIRVMEKNGLTFTGETDAGEVRYAITLSQFKDRT